MAVYLAASRRAGRHRLAAAARPRASADARLVVWVPDRGHGLPPIGGQGISTITHATVAGGWLISARICRGGYTLTVGPNAPDLSYSCATSQVTDNT